MGLPTGRLVVSGHEFQPRWVYVILHCTLRGLGAGEEWVNV